MIRLEVIKSLLQDNIQWLRKRTPGRHEDDRRSGRLEAILNFYGGITMVDTSHEFWIIKTSSWHHSSTVTVELKLSFGLQFTVTR